MATVNFLYRSTKREAPLNIRLLYRAESNEFEKGYKDYVLGAKTGLIVSKEYWDKSHFLKRPKDISISNKQVEVNTELNKIENHILKAFRETDPLRIDKAWLNMQMDFYYNPPHQNKKAPDNLIDYIDFYLEERSSEISKASEVKYNVIKHKMERFQKERRKVILIKDINEQFKREFAGYYKKHNYAQNTAARELGMIKTFCKHARTHKVETHPQMDGLKLEKEKVKKIYLSFEELEKIENKKGLIEHLENAKDWLIISCYTGQRISDFMRFKKDMIRVENGKHLIEFTQKKTGKLMTVPLHDKVLKILEKRDGEFPRRISDQRYNEYIKDVCEKVGFKNEIEGSKQVETFKGSGKYRKENNTYEKWELITSHIGRRSFATNYYGKIPTSYLIYITGHSTEAMFLNYIGKSNKDLALEITNYF